MSLPVDGAWSASPVKATIVKTRTRRLIMVVGWRVDGVLAGSSCTRALAALGNGGEWRVRARRSQQWLAECCGNEQ